MHLAVFASVVGSAFVHASWNAALRQVKGNFAVTYLGMALGSAFALTIAYGHAVVLEDFSGFTGVLSLGPAGFCCVASAFSHAAYLLLLTYAYQKGDLSVVYPIARGSGVAFTAVGAGPVVGESLPIVVVGGLVGVTVGVFLVGFSGACERKHEAYAPVPLPESSDARDKVIVLKGSISCTIPPSCVHPDCEESLLAAPENCQSQTSVEIFMPEKADFDPACMPPTAADEATSSQPAASLSTCPKSGAIDDQEPPVSLSDFIQPLSGCFVGLSIASYHLVDKRGVSALTVVPIAYTGMMNGMVVLLLLPYIALYQARREQAHEALSSFKRYILIVGLGSVSCYLVILAAFQMAPVASVCAVRSSSVIFGCVLGVMGFHEPCSVMKLFGVALILAGVVAIELA